MTNDIGPIIRSAVNRAIYETRQDRPRSHLGFSVIGDQCPRKIWYGWRWFKYQRHIGRMLRLFDRGKEEEKRVIDWLSTIGAMVQPVDPATGRQWLASDLGGHYGGSCDGKISGLDRFGLPGFGIFECKTHNEASFNQLVKKGVATSKPGHYVQCQGYMHYLGCEWTLYVAVNKNDDDLYIEIIYHKPEISLAYRARAIDIMQATEPPRQISTKSSFWICKMCDFHEVCHHRNETTPDRNCRSCVHSWADLDSGEWRCGAYSNAVIPYDFQLKGCETWTPGA